jgi:hypothetical protein
MSNEMFNFISGEMVTLTLENKDGDKVDIEDLIKATTSFLEDNYDVVIRKVCTIAQAFIGPSPRSIIDFAMGYICKALIETGGVSINVTSRKINEQEAKEMSIKSIDNAIDRMKLIREKIDKGSNNESNNDN